MDAKLLMMAAGAGDTDFYPYTVDNSARFDGTTSDYLNFTPGAGNRKLWTFSTWLKRCASTQQDILIAGADSNNKTQITIESSNKINFELVSGGAGAGSRQTTAVLLDPSSWYHIVIVCDSASGTPEDRQQIWLNGVRITSFSANTTTTLNTDTFFSNSQAMYLGRRSYSTAANLNGYLSQTCFIDGAALTASSFGEDKNGVWVPKDPTGLTFGDEGWLLAYATSSALGDDTSGNTNDWTVNGLAAADQMTDTPTNNFCTGNPLYTPAITYSDGNLTFTTGNYLSNAYGTTFIPQTGEWYFEVTVVTVAEMVIGLSRVPFLPYDEAKRIGYYRAGGANNSFYIESGTRESESGASYTDGDVIGLYINSDSSEISFYKNNALQGGTAFTISDLNNLVPFVQQASGTGSVSGTFNFGSNAFTYTPPGSALALSTANFPEPTIGPNSATLTSEVFDAVLYTGNGTVIGSGGKTISSLAFQPDFTWIKNRDATDSHMLFDAVRGATKYLESDTTDAEVTATESLASFTATGFTLGNNVAVNTNTEDYVAWNWKANGSGATNEDGAIDSTVSVNQGAGFSIVNYTGTGSTTTVGHGLGVAPNFIIFKDREEGAGYNWASYSSMLGATYNTGGLDQTNAADAHANYFNNTAPTSTVFTVSTYGVVNTSADVMLAYCFASIDGFSKFGSWVGESAGEFIYTGFRPAFVLMKRTSNASGWYIFDDARGFNGALGWLGPNVTTAEGSTSGFQILSNGFRDSAWIGDTGETIIYAAFAETPFKYSNAR